MRRIGLVLSAAILVLAAFTLFMLVSGNWSFPRSWATWRDIAIVFSAFFWMLSGFLFCILLLVLILLTMTIRRILNDNAVPALDSLKDSLDNVRSTTETVGQSVVSPIFRVYGVVSGVRSGLGAFKYLPDRLRGKRRKRGRK